jgi:alpha-tubulin suppressor-like RCC1 family protein
MRAAVVFLAGWCSLSGCRSQGEPEEADAHPSTSPSDQADTNDAAAAPTADPPAEKAPLRATHIAAGAGTSYARMSDGTIRAWGDGSVFALGRAQAGPVGRPLEVPVIENATGVFAGGLDAAMACATLADGQTSCWGSHWAFPLPRKSPMEGSPPTLVPSLAGAQEITIGSGFGCAVMEDATVKCWGNVPGWPMVAIGDHRGPTTVAGLTDIVAVRSSWSHACALGKDGHVSCWGDNGNLRVAPAEGSPRKVEVPRVVEDVEGAVGLAIAQDFSCALLGDGSLRCWGGAAVGAVNVSRGRVSEIPIDGEVVRLSHAGVAPHLCAVVRDGSLRCVGYGRHGQLGVGTGSWSNEFVTVPELVDVETVATSRTHSCALTKDGRAWCWGGNGKGGLGDGTFSDHIAPAPVAALLDVDLSPPAAPEMVDDAPTESYEELPPDCKHPTLALEIPGRDRTTFEVKSASASVAGKTARVHLRDHGFDWDKTFVYEDPRGDQLRVELVVTKKKRIAKKERDEETGELETTWSEREVKVAPGTYLTFPAWLAADEPNPRQEVKVSMRDANGLVLMETSPVRKGDTQSVDITRIDSEWICGRLDLSSPRGKLVGEFAARVHE